MRLSLIDIIKGIAIIMIVNVHLLSGQFFFIGSTYHVIAFFYTAGIIHGLNEKWNVLSLGQFVRQKALRLIYPYITLSVCYIGFHVLLNVIRGETIYNDVINDSIFNTLTLRGVGTLWFLPILFISETIFFFLKKKKMNNAVVLIIGLVAVFLASYLNLKGICGLKWYGNNSLYGITFNTPLTLLLASSIACFFTEIGYIFYKYYLKSLKSEGTHSTYTLLTIIICIISFFIDFILIDKYAGDLHKLDIGNPFIYLICSVSGIVFVTTLSLLIDRFSKYIREFLIYCGKNSLVIMTTHTEYYINSVAYLAITGICSVISLSFCSKVISGLSLLLILIIEMGVIYVVNHTLLKYIYQFPKLKKDSRG